MKPWEETWQHLSGAYPEEVSVVVPKGHPYVKVCDVWGDNADGDMHETCALIAAAPEMYRALTEMVADYAACDHFEDGVVARAVSAIRKARGEI